MAKARYTLVAIVEQDITSNLTNDLEAIMESEIKGIKSYPEVILDMPGVQVNVSGELLADEEDPNQLSMSIDNNQFNIPTAEDNE